MRMDIYDLVRTQKYDISYSTVCRYIYATFCFKRSHYSVPEQLINQLVDVKVYSTKLKIYKNKKLLCIHERCYSQKWILKLDHYLKTLVMKPGAI